MSERKKSRLSDVSFTHERGNIPDNCKIQMRRAEKEHRSSGYEVKQENESNVTTAKVARTPSGYEILPAANPSRIKNGETQNGYETGTSNERTPQSPAGNRNTSDDGYITLAASDKERIKEGNKDGVHRGNPYDYADGEFPGYQTLMNRSKPRIPEARERRIQITLPSRGPRFPSRPTTEDPPKRRVSKRMIIVIVGVIAVAVVAAIAIWFFVFKDSSESVIVPPSPKPGVIGNLFGGKVTVSTSLPGDLNSTSGPFMLKLAYELCSGISDLALGHTVIKRVYNGCSVKSVQPGNDGLEVHFTIFTKVSEVVDDDIRQLILGSATENNEIVFGDVNLLASSLHIFPREENIEGTEEVDAMYVPFLRNCSVQRGDQCVTPPSQCIDGVCACPHTAYYDVKLNICQEPNISMVMSKDSTQTNEPLTITCSLLMKDWNHLFVVKESETFDRCLNGDKLVEIWNTSSGFKNYTRSNVTVSSQLQINTATVTLHFDHIECIDDGVYKCFATSSLNSCEPNLSAAGSLLVTYASSTPSNPHISGGSSRIYPNVDYNVTCEGLVGRQTDGQPFADLALLIYSPSTQKKTTYNRTNTVSDQCQFKQSLTFSFTANSSWDGAVMTCVTTSSNGVEQHGNSITIAVIVSRVFQFTKPYYQEIIGQPITLTCEADNLVNLTQIQITRGTINREIALITMTSQHASIEGVTIDVHNTWLQPYAGKLSVIIQNTTCADKDKFHCKAAGFIANTTVNLTRAAERPTLVLSDQIVENMATWGDMMFHCLAQLGDRSRTIDIESDINGTFSSMFKAPNELGHRLGVIEYSIADCGYSVRRNFEFNKINMTLDRVRLRCVIHPGPGESFPALTSDEKVIHVVPANHCLEKQQKTLPHVYFCSLYVKCSEDGSVNSVQKCSAGQCFNPTSKECEPCDQAGCT